MTGFQRIVRMAALASVAASGFAALPAVAQEELPGASADSGDIVVTARRREETLMSVPVAVTAYTGEQLEASGALDITSISDTTPNVTLENSRATNSTLSAFIRGVGQQDPVGGFEAGVGIYLDDVYLNRPQAAVLDIYDVERIEVLRGPQGTLYGRNTIGGAVKYVTRQLPRDLSVRARATYGTYDQAEGTLSVSAPVGDLLRVGGGIARLSRGGFGDNLTNGLENYNKDVWAGRLSMEMGGYGEPVFIRIAGDYTRDKSNPRGGLNLPGQDIEAYGISANISIDLSDSLTLRSISAWRKDSSWTPIDFDALPSVDVDVPSYYGNEQLSQEFQIVYSSDRLNGLVGFYYLDAEATTQFDVILATTGELLALPGLNGYTAGDVRTDTWSVFGDFTFDLTEQLSLSAGARYTRDRRFSTILKQNKILGASPQFGGVGVPIQTITDFTGRASFSDFNPRASIAWRPNRDHMLYASYAQGFKGGGFDPRGSANIAPDTNNDGVRSYQEIYDFFLFQPETVDSYEIGYKGTFWDGRARIALTGFYGDYKDVQIPGSIGVDVDGDGLFESFAGVTTNAAKATFKGVEAEVYARFAEDFAGAGSRLSFTGTLGYIDGEYDEYIVNDVDVSNQRAIQNTPRWTMSGTLAASAPVGGGSIGASTTVSYRSMTHQFEVPSAYLDQPGYALWDASIVWTAPDDRFTFGVHGKNLTDKRYITSGYQFGAADAAGAFVPTLGLEGTVTSFYGNPRQIFASVGFQF